MEALVAAGVRFILIGGLAVGVHGAVRATRDMDIVPDPDSQNLERLAAVLRKLEAQQIGVDADLLPYQATDPDGLAAGGRTAGGGSASGDDNAHERRQDRDCGGAAELDHHSL